MPAIAQRLNTLTAEEPHRLDRLLVAVAALAPDPPLESVVLAELDRLAAMAASPTPSADEVVAHAFGTLAFLGDSEGYHRSANSYIHRVLARRRGIPITLAGVAAELGRRNGVTLSVVGLPGHVLLGDGARPTRWFDPFTGGAVLDLDDCRMLFGRFHPVERFEPSMVEPIDARAFTSRMLNNLKISHQRAGDLRQLAQVLAVSADLDWAPPSERAELARVLTAAGRDEQAADAWERMIELDPKRASLHRAAVRRHRARRN